MVDFSGFADYRIDESPFLKRFQEIVKREFHLGFPRTKNVYIFKVSPGLAVKLGFVGSEDQEFGATLNSEFPNDEVLIVLHSHRTYSGRRLERAIYHELAHLLLDQLEFKFKKSGHEAISDFISEFVLRGKCPKDVGWQLTFSKDKKARAFVKKHGYNL